jgi:site-specific recombinase XerD
MLLAVIARQRTMPGFHAGRPPHNRGIRYPRPTNRRGDRRGHARGRDARHGRRLRELIVVLWRAGLRIHEALALSEARPRPPSRLAARGPRQGGRRREVGMDDWAWEQLRPWLTARVDLPVGPLLCIATGPTRGRAWSAGAARTELRHAAARPGVRRRFAPHQLRHAHAVEMAPEGVPLIVIQRQLGHTNLGITSIYLQGIDNTEIIDTVHARRPPMVPVDATLRL